MTQSKPASFYLCSSIGGGGGGGGGVTETRDWTGDGLGLDWEITAFLHGLILY